MQHRMRAALRWLGAALGAVVGLLCLAPPAYAHGGVTGTQDVVQDFGVLIFLLAVVLIGAGVLAWVTLSPQPDEEDEDLDAISASAAPKATSRGQAPAEPPNGRAAAAQDESAAAGAHPAERARTR